MATAPKAPTKPLDLLRKPAQGQNVTHTPLTRVLTGSKEICTLEVNGTLFTNWTTVRVEQRVTQAFPIFQFECTEEMPIPLRITGLQFTPGDIVTVYVGGVPVVFGFITERHVGYDGTQHGVKLIGTGDTFDLTNSSVPLEKLNGHDGKNWQALASELMQHLGIKLHTMGAVDPKPYDRVQVQPGEVIMQVLERYARMRNIVVGSNANGGLLAIGEHEVQPTGDLAEGYNILRANAVVRDNMVYKRYLAVGQGAGSDAKHGDEQNKQIAQRWGTSTRNRYSIVVADLADDLYGLERRVKMEEVFSEGSNIEASITVQGWFKNNNTSEEIWRAGEYYTIFSPSLILNDTVLGCAGCVYEQTNGGGTTTTMQMVKPIHMNGQYNYRNEAQEYARRVRERRPPPTTPEVKTK